MLHLRDLSLDKLLTFALDEALVTRYVVTDDAVRLYQGETVIELPIRRAATFLVGMLRGRSWYVAGDRVPEPVTEKPLVETVEVPLIAGDVAPEAREYSLRRDVGPANGAPARSEEAGVEETLDALLNFTFETGLILGYEKHEDVRRVAIRIAACTSVFSYVDALTFLFDVVEDELREHKCQSAS